MAKKKNKTNKNQSNLSITSSAAPLDYNSAIREARSAISHIDRKIQKSVHKGVQYDWLNNANFNNLIYPKDKIPDRLLRLIEKKNGIVGAIITLRIQQALEFARPSEDRDIPGWEFALVKKGQTMTPEREKQKAFLEEFMFKTHVPNYQGLEPKSDSFKDVIIKYVRDRILIDKVVWEVERDRKGQAVALWVLDGATIVPVLPGGFYGSTSMFNIGMTGGYNKLGEEIRKAKIADVPPIEKIAFVQELLYGSSGGGIVAAFESDDVIYDLENELNDIRYYKQGMSVVEKANMAIVAFINSLTFNSNGLSRGAIPKIAIAMGKESGYSQEQLEDAEDEWAANFMAMDGQWNIPLLNGDAKVLNLLPNNRDMEYQKYMEFTGALTCAIIGADSAEIGLRLNQAQSVLSENQDAKQIFSKSRGIKELMTGFSFIVNRFLDKSNWPFANDWEFRFNGLQTIDKSFEADLRKKDVETIKTIDEVRAEVDLPPLPDDQGKIILNQVWLQNKQAAEQAAQQEAMGGMGGEEDEAGFGGFSDDDADAMADEAMSDFQKAVRLM